MSTTPQAAVEEALADLIKDRAKRGNPQSKHGEDTAWVMRRLDEIARRDAASAAHQAAVAEALVELITERAKRGNCQSKHGVEAAWYFELCHVMRRLDELLGETP